MIYILSTRGRNPQRHYPSVEGYQEWSGPRTTLSAILPLAGPRIAATRLAASMKGTA